MIPPRRIALTPVISDQERAQIEKEMAGLNQEIKRLYGQQRSIQRRIFEASQRWLKLNDKLAG